MYTLVTGNNKDLFNISVLSLQNKSHVSCRTGVQKSVYQTGTELNELV